MKKHIVLIVITVRFIFHLNLMLNRNKKNYPNIFQRQDFDSKLLEIRVLVYKIQINMYVES